MEELKKHIHKELFADRFPTAPPMEDWKQQQKEMIMLRSVKILRRHGLSEEAVSQMLQEKFLLTPEQATEFMKKESDSECQSL